MICKTPNCGRAVPWTGHNFCRDCIGTVLRTGRPPELRKQPAWVERMARNAKILGPAA